MELRYLSNTIKDDKRRCVYCQEVFEGPPLKLYCQSCYSWIYLLGWREVIFERDNHTCIYCQTPNGELQVDHVYPLHRGGDNTPSNLVTACRRCNSKKSINILPPFKEAAIKKEIRHRNRVSGIPADMYLPGDFERNKFNVTLARRKYKPTKRSGRDK